MPASDDEREDARETRQERINRELLELLNELRVALPGVQFLFAFLLVVPFQQSAGRFTEFERDVHYVALLSAAVATVLLIAPAAQHRVLFRQLDKENLLRRSNRSALVGLWIWSSEFQWAARFFATFTRKARDTWRHARRHPVSSATVTVGGLVAAAVAFWAVWHYQLVDRATAALGF